MALRTLILCLVCALPVCAVAQTQSSPKRIVFARGAIVANAKGYLRGIRDEVWFVLRAGPGQHMKVEIRGRGPTRGVVVFPSLKQDGGPGGIIYDADIDETGDYKFRVTESMMAEPWRGSFTLRVEIMPQIKPSTSSSTVTPLLTALKPLRYIFPPQLRQDGMMNPLIFS